MLTLFFLRHSSEWIRRCIGVLLIFALLPINYAESAWEEYSIFEEEISPGVIRYGYKNTEGEIVVPAEYIELTPYVEGACCGRRINPPSCELIDENGCIITHISYNSSSTWEWSPYLLDSGIEDNVYNCFDFRLLDRSGNYVLDEWQDWIDLYEDFIYVCTMDGEEYLMNYELERTLSLSAMGCITVDMWYRDDSGIWYCLVKSEREGLIGVINNHGEWVKQPTYSKLGRQGVGPVWEAWLPDGRPTNINMYGEECEWPRDDNGNYIW